MPSLKTQQKAEHGIIMSGNHPKLILDGTKTQTRRVLKPQPDLGLDPFESYSHIEVGRYHPALVDKDGDMYPGDEIFGAYTDDGEWGWKCPYGQVGDRLWVRETWEIEQIDYPMAEISYVADTYGHDDHDVYIADKKLPKNIDRVQPSIFMPRWASRITLEITEVRVERVQEITFEDCLREGIMSLDPDVIAELGKDWQPPKANDKEPVDELADDLDSEIRHIWMKLWDSLNAKRGYGWEVNPWVWVITFQKI